MMIEQLQVEPPKEKIDPIKDNDDAFLLIESYVIRAEKQFQGIHRGPERLQAVTQAVIRAIVLPDNCTIEAAKLMALMVYTSIALKLPDNLRHSKTEPPVPDREFTP